MHAVEEIVVTLSYRSSFRETASEINNKYYNAFKMRIGVAQAVNKTYVRQV